MLSTPGIRRASWAALAVAMAGSGALILHYERDLLYISDEIKFLQIAGVQPLGDLFDPIFGHLLAVSIFAMKAPLALFGIESRLPYSMLQIAALFACAALLYVYARRRIGPVAALAPAIFILYLGSAVDVMVQPLIGFPIILAIALGLGALLLLEEPTRRRDVAACVLLCLSVGSFTTGLPFVAGAAVAILLGEDRRRRAFVVVVPVLLYAVWRLAEIGPSDSNIDVLDVLSFPAYVVDSIAVTVSALFGRPDVVGRGAATGLYLNGWDLQTAANALFLTAVELVAAIAIFARVRRREAVPATLWVALAVPAALWLLGSVALADFRTPGESRYFFVNAVVVLMLGCELARGMKLSRLATVCIVGLAVVGAIGNLPRIRDTRTGQAAFTEQGRALLAVVLLEAPGTDPDFEVWINANDIAPFLSARAGTFPELTERYGDVSLPLAELPKESAQVRADADALAVRMLRIGLEPGGSLGAIRNGCAMGSGPLPLPPGGATLFSLETAEVGLSRFGEPGAVPIGALVGGRSTLLRIPGDRSSTPWLIDPVGTARVSACPIS